jgi:hypothetical protein
LSLCCGCAKVTSIGSENADVKSSSLSELESAANGAVTPYVCNAGPTVCPIDYFIVAAYHAILGRAPSLQGTPAEIDAAAQVYLATYSAHPAAHTGGRQTAAQQAVVQLLLDFGNAQNPGRPNGILAYTENLTQQMGFEYTHDLVKAYYLEFVRRAPSDQELNLGVRFLASGQTDQALQELLLSSSDFAYEQTNATLCANPNLAQCYQPEMDPSVGKSEPASNSSGPLTASDIFSIRTAIQLSSAPDYFSILMVGLYQTLLDRTPSPAELAAMANAHTQYQMPFGSFLAPFVNSAEARTDFVYKAYQAYLGRPPSPTDLSVALGALASGKQNEDIQMAILSSAEFFTDSQPTQP